jgi:hypothetical protein
VEEFGNILQLEWGWLVDDDIVHVALLAHGFLFFVFCFLSEELLGTS